MNKKMKSDIVFIGSSPLGLQRLMESPYLSVKGVLCLAKRITEPLIEMAADGSLAVDTFKCIEDFRKLIEIYSPSMPFFIYQLDMLVPGDLTRKYCFYNVHRGRLPTNRGPNPDIWPILNGDKETALSLHRINEKVDSGILIDAFDVSISDVDDTESVRQKLEQGLPKLIRALREYLQGTRVGKELHGGVYRPWIKESDYTIDQDKDSIEIMGRKIRSQSQYNGAIIRLAGKKYYVTEIVAIERKDVGEGFVFEADGGVVRVACSSHVITLKQNLEPGYPPPPISPPSKRL